MATVSGPLLSTDASGAIGGSIVFSRWKGRAIVRKIARPKVSNTVKQLSLRAMMRFLAQSWISLSAPDQLTWTLPSAAKKVSPFNAYIAENMRRWRNFQSPCTSFPAAGGETPEFFPDVLAYPGVRCITLQIDPGDTLPSLGYLLFRSTENVPGSFDTFIAAILTFGSNDPITFVDSPLLAGTYYYRIGHMMVGGAFAVDEVDYSETATD